MKLVLFFLLLSAKGGSCLPITLSSQDRKIQLDNHQTEIKQSLNDETENWSKLGQIIAIGIVLILVTLACCYIRARYWPLIKNTHDAAANNIQIRHTLVIEKPSPVDLKVEITKV